MRWLVMALILGVLPVAGWLWWSRVRAPADTLAPGRAAYERGDWEEATARARERLKRARDDRDALRLMARASVRLGRDATAKALYQRLGPPAMQAEDLCLLGVALRREGKRTPALQVWEAARALDPAHAETLFELTRAYYNADQMDQAAATGIALESRPGWESRAEALLGTIELERNDLEAAAAYWRRALDRPRPTVRAEGVPWPIVPRIELARILLRAGRADEAGEQLRIVLADAPDPEAYWLLSRAALQRKDWSAARADYERGASFRDENPTQPDPGRYVGSSKCAGCHAAQFQPQRASRHARTFFRADELGALELPASTVSDASDPKVGHVLRREADGRIRQETRVGGRVFDAVVQYAFGSGDRGLTLVGRDPAGKAYELRISDYPSSDAGGEHSRPAARWDVTAGHPRAPAQPEEFLGQPLSEDLIRRCMVCHLTDARAVLDGSGPCAADRGIGCERCHGPGGNHLLALEGKLVELDPAIGRPSLASGERVVKLCAGCHSPRGKDVERDDPTAARFQGTTLTWSRCYTESGNALDCISCHDPHRDAVTSTAHYEARCLSCHSGPGRTPGPGWGAGAASSTAATPKPAKAARAPLRSLRDGAPHTTCPVNPSNGCIGCHMPAVEGIVPHSSFTDHFIRAHRD